MAHHPSDELNKSELMAAVERFEEELDKAFDAKAAKVTVLFGDAITVLRAANILLKVSEDETKN